MKRLSIILMALFVTSLFIFSSFSYTLASEKKATVLRLAAPWPPMDPVTVQIEAFAERFNKRAAGRYVVQIHPGESLMKMGESFDGLRTGATEMAGWPIGVFASVDRRFAAAELPFLANNGPYWKGGENKEVKFEQGLPMNFVLPDNSLFQPK